MHGVHGSRNRVALSATLHCLTGCAIGEVLGMLVGTALGWHNLATVALSIAVMEIVDNTVMLLVPGALDAGLDEILFWASLAFSLVVAGAAAFPVNRWLIARGKGHAVVHAYHGHAH
jgi:small basic protein